MAKSKRSDYLGNDKPRRCFLRQAPAVSETLKRLPFHSPLFGASERRERQGGSTLVVGGGASRIMTMATPFHLSSCSAMAMAPARGQASESFRTDRLAGSFSNARRFSSARMARPQHLSASPETTRAPLSKTRAVAVPPNQLDTPQQPPENEGKSGAGKYYFVVANAKFMLDEEEHFKELMFERLRNFGERNREQDFWLVVEPKFLDKFPSITNRLARPAVALISTDGTWMTFMKLRLDRVLYAEFEAESLEEALACNPADLKFPAPESWSAPYPKYEHGWWEQFLPPTNSKHHA